MLVLNTAHYDPTRTTLLRRKMVSVLRSRFMQLKKQDYFNKANIEQVIAGYTQQWLPYTQFAFTTGVKRSFTEARAALITQGNILQARQAEFLTLMSGSINAQTTDLADRVHSELLSIASDVRGRINRVVADGKTQSLSQRQIRQNIKRQIDIGFNRSKAVVQTELTRSHAEGQLAAYERLGVEKVGVLVEWTNPNRGTSLLGNPSPCKVCKPLLGVSLTLKEAKGMIPRHPNCMCSFKIIAVREAHQVRQKREIERAIRRSVKAEGSKRTKWSGANRKIARRR